MKKTKEIISNIILIIILLIISALIFYMFFYSGYNSPLPKEEKTEGKRPPSTELMSPTETKYKGKDVYIIDPSVKIRSEPKNNATVLIEKNKGEKLTVSGAWGDWFEVIFNSERKGWVLRDQVSDRVPSLKTEDTPPIQSPEIQEKNMAIDQIRVELDNSVTFLNQLSLQQFSKEMITGFEILENGSKLIVYVTEAWYFLPPVQKQVMFNLIAMQYGKLSCQYNVRSECTTNDFPTISFLNQKNKEIARIGANQPLQVFE